MNRWIIYHNKRCSQSRAALALLYEKNITATVVDYLLNPPSPAVLKDLLKKLNLPAGDLVRQKEPIFAQLKLNLADEEAVIQAICKHPILLARPIVIRGNKAVIARPPDRLLDLL